MNPYIMISYEIKIVVVLEYSKTASHDMEIAEGRGGEVWRHRG